MNAYSRFNYVIECGFAIFDYTEDIVCVDETTVLFDKVNLNNDLDYIPKALKNPNNYNESDWLGLGI